MQPTSTRPSEGDISLCLVVVRGQKSSIRLAMTVDREQNPATAIRLLPLSEWNLVAGRSPQYKQPCMLNGSWAVERPLSSEASFCVTMLNDEAGPHRVSELAETCLHPPHQRWRDSD
jgi:hypothetical protein